MMAAITKALLEKLWTTQAAFMGMGFLAGLAFVLVSFEAVHFSGTSEFCSSCHEMKVVAEQGWMKSPHYANDKGVRADCSDCHVPPGLANTLWVKTRDGSKDVYAHFLGESDPEKMDWAHLEAMARSKVKNESCLRCHANLTPGGASIKMIVAHREFQRMAEAPGCLECHRQMFHGGFLEFISLRTPAKTEEDAK